MMPCMVLNFSGQEGRCKLTENPKRLEDSFMEACSVLGFLAFLQQVAYTCSDSHATLGHQKI